MNQKDKKYKKHSYVINVKNINVQKISQSIEFYICYDCYSHSHVLDTIEQIL